MGSIETQDLCKPCYLNITGISLNLENDRHCSNCKKKVSGSKLTDCKCCGGHFCKHW